MKFNKQNLLTLLISFFIFSSCENPDGIGLEVDPSQAINGQLNDTATVLSTTVKEDSVLTNGLLQYPLGYLQDAVFGKTESSLAFTLNLPATTFTPGTSPVLDSAVLVLKYGDQFYGDSVSSVLAVNVHQLNENYNTSASGGYFNTKSWNFNAAVIGSKALSRFAVGDSLIITKPVKGAADSVLTVPPQIRIPINAAFINSSFLNADPANFATAAAFQSFLKGLYVTVNKSGSTGTGSIGFLNLSAGSQSQLELYYKNQNAGVVDTVLTTFPIGGSAAATFKHDYTGTEIQTQLNNPGQQFTKTFVQPMAGVRTKVNFPFLDQLKSLGNIAINKAELVVSVDQTTPTPFAPAPRLTLYQNDIAGQRRPIPDGDTQQGGDSRSIGPGFGGFYDAVNKRYTFIITSYIQDILSGKSKQYDIFIAPVYAPKILSQITDVPISPSASTAAQSVLGSGNNPAHKMKLNIIYTPQN